MPKKKKEVKPAETRALAQKREELKLKASVLQDLKDEYMDALRKKIGEKSVDQYRKYLGERSSEMVYAIAETLERGNFFNYCSAEHVASFLGIHKNTVFKWVNEHKKFALAYHTWEQKRNAVFYSFAPHMKPAVWIFLAKNWLGLSDRQITELEAGKGFVQYISHLPDPRGAPVKAEIEGTKTIEVEAEEVKKDLVKDVEGELLE